MQLEMITSSNTIPLKTCYNQPLYYNQDYSLSFCKSMSQKFIDLLDSLALHKEDLSRHNLNLRLISTHE